MPDEFFDRERELAALDAAWRSPGSSLVLLWGRRRTGKTSLLGRFVGSKRAIFYGATEQAPAAELEAFSKAARDALRPSGTDFLAHGHFTDWATAFDYLVQRAQREKLAVVIDEFPYLVDADPSLPSILQRFWDHLGRRSKLKLILCGSAQAVMEELQADRAPLFGRVDVRLQLRPFSHSEAALFTPRLPPEQKAIAYGVLGGMPTYLSRWRDDLGHRANLRHLFGNSASPLLEEGEYVLSNELHEGAGYFRILRAIASGNRTYSGIRRFADIDVQRQLERLIQVGLVERVVPITENPSRTKRAVYRIADNFLSFWFRFVYRHRADVARGLGKEVVDRTILPGLDDYMGEPWEEMCREHIRHMAAKGTLPVVVSSVGRWWSTDNTVEIDIVGLDGGKVVLAGSVKWAKAVESRELERLRRATESLPNRASRMQLVLCARQRLPKVDALCLSARDVFAGE
ncbi:MAG: ATP-binding protein [Polyangiaceae bacterium]